MPLGDISVSFSPPPTSSLSYESFYFFLSRGNEPGAGRRRVSHGSLVLPVVAGDKAQARRHAVRRSNSNILQPSDGRHEVYRDEMKCVCVCV